MQDHLLNESQKRSVTITLRLFEERLAEVERQLTVDERGVLYERVAHFPPRQIRALQKQLAEARAAIQEIAREFDLPRENQSPVRRIFGLMSITWESLEEIHSKYLKAYGHVDPRLPAAIDPWAEKLTRLVRELEHTAVQSPDVFETNEEEESE